jgi:adenosylcobinamide kinase/adenosylcobinamide-phosphate guanylyltransferase
MTGKLIFLLGGARSGKSHYAEQWARSHGENVLFVATAQAFDDEMRERIARHCADRPTNWQTLEAPLQLAQQLDIYLNKQRYDTVLVDCITLLASNVLLTLPDDCSQDEADDAILREVNALIAVYRESSATWLVVSNEVGMGVVPPSRANQRIAQAADEVLLLVAGLPWILKRPI